jgi:hypothetical protein
MSIATELTALSGHITNAYDAVQTKGGTIPANKNMANLDDAILSIPAGADITNGVIKQYKAASSDIPADTFVELVDNIAENPSAGASVTISGGTNNDDTNSTTRLDQDRVFATFSYSRKTYACVCTISGDTITRDASKMVELSSSTGSGTLSQAVALTPTLVFVAFYGGGGVQAMLCTVSGDNITPGVATKISSRTGKLTVIKLSESSVLVITGGDVCAVVCTISNGVISAGEEVVVATGAYSDIATKRFGAVAVASDSVFLAYQRVAEGASTYGGLYAIMLSVSGSVVTASLPTLITSDSVGYKGDPVACLSAPGKVFLAYRSVPNSSMYGVLCSVYGTTISVGTPAPILQEQNTPPTAIAALDASTIAVAYYSSGHKVAFFKTSDSAITTKGTVNTLINNGTPSLTVLSENKMVLFAGSYGTRGGVIYGDIVARASQTKINGVTIDDITTSTAGDVWTFAGDTMYDGDADIRRF